jgi:hypothetical protein
MLHDAAAKIAVALSVSNRISLLHTSQGYGIEVIYLTSHHRPDLTRL